eukprot:52912-Chlamydomonas_euryale.AAC.1
MVSALAAALPALRVLTLEGVDVVHGAGLLALSARGVDVRVRGVRTVEGGGRRRRHAAYAWL